MAPEADTTENDHSDCINPHEANGNHPPLPDWVRAGCADWGELLKVAEWRDDGGEYRGGNGWKGSDLVHDRNSPVRVLDYYVRYGPGIAVARGDDERTATTVYKNFPRGGVGTTLTGIVHFTKRAESHKGYCHGGSMCSIMDDVIGWVGFLVTGDCVPWSGYTVQVNSKLQKPVRVDSVLMVRAEITSVERRKVSIEAVISDPSERRSVPAGHRDPSVHATASGLVVVNRGVLCEERQPRTLG